MIFFGAGPLQEETYIKNCECYPLSDFIVRSLKSCKQLVNNKICKAMRLYCSTLHFLNTWVLRIYPMFVLWGLNQILMIRGRWRFKWEGGLWLRSGDATIIEIAQHSSPQIAQFRQTALSPQRPEVENRLVPGSHDSCGHNRAANPYFISSLIATRLAGSF